MCRIYISCLLLITLSIAAKGQNSAFELEQFNMEEIVLRSRNAALLNTMAIPNLGESSLYFNRTNGDFKHPLLAKDSKHYGFSSERYQSLKDWTVYGRFNVDMGNEKGVPNTTQLNPLRINPYIIVDSLSGNWNKQAYVIDVKVASPLFYETLGVGLDLKYNVTTGARQRDPRPQNTNNELELTPALTYKMNAHSTFGLTATYHHFVEDFTVSNINSAIVHNMYKLIGVGEYVGSSPIFMATSGITRRYNGNRYGGALQYAYRSNNWKLLGEGFLYQNVESAKDGTATPQEAGKHAYLAYGGNVGAVYKRENIGHRLNVEWNQLDIDNTEYHQYLDPDTRQFVTLFSNIFNTNLVTNSSLQYQLTGYRSGMMNWLLSASGSYSGWDNKYSSNKSQQTVDRMTYAVNFKKYVTFRNTAALSFEVRPSYSQCIDSEFAYDEKSYSTNFVAKDILYPTNAFLSTSYFGLGAGIRYNFKPLRSNTRLYLEISENYVKAAKDSEYFNKSQHRLDWQVSVGLLTF